jgi:class 3 adenylate cyclase/tetratricopeptide (TPR) repeat protein
MSQISNLTTGRSAPSAPSVELPSRHAVVLVVDLVESVRLMAIDEKGVIGRWQAFLAEVQHAILPNTGGRLVKSLGDGLMVEFARAPEAVRAASSMHGWMAHHCEPLSDGSKLILRAGIHASTIFDTNVDILGVGVNLAARVATLAEGGETVATVDARDLLSDTLDADVEDLGDCHLKHVEHTVRVYRLGPAQQRDSLPPRDSYATELCVSLAVIPFSDLLSTATTGGMGDIIADSVIGQLSQSPGLHVVSRLSTSCLRDRTLPLNEIAARLGVRYVVSGTYTLVSGYVSISSELSDTATGHVVWSGRIGGDWQDLLSVDSQLTHEIADTVHRKILETAASKAVVRPLPTLESYELFLGGIAMMHRASRDEFETSRRLLESLTERHRRIALPYAWLGKWYVLQSIQGAAVASAPQAASLALDRTGRALDLEPSSALALAIEGFVYCHLKKDLDTANLRLREACALNPSEGFAWLFLAVQLAFKGESSEALGAAQRALSLSPMDPLRYYYDSLMGSCEFSAGHYEDAIRWCENSRRRNRQHLSTLRVLIASNMALGREEQARQIASELRKVRPEYSVAAYEAHSVAALYPFGQQIAKAMRQAGVP